jgi:hypothetical protein
MSSALDSLLESIDPSRSLDSVSAEIDRAVNSFSMRRATIDDFDEYQGYLADFCQHIEREVLRLGPGVSENREFYWTRCSHILNNEFGPDGWKNAFDMVRTGQAGGLYRILKLIADKMSENYAQNEISARINNFLNNLTTDEKLAAANEYVSKYGHLLPPEFTEANAARIKVNFQKVLKEHPKIIRRMRGVIR